MNKTLVNQVRINAARTNEARANEMRANAAEANQVNHLSMRLAELERKVDYLFKTLNLPYQDEPLIPCLDTARDLLRQGRKNEAVANYQQQVGVGQREAKEIVELLEEWLTG